MAHNVDVDTIVAAFRYKFPKDRTPSLVGVWISQASGINGIRKEVTVMLEELLAKVSM